METFACSEIFSEIYFRNIMGIFMSNVLHIRIEKGTEESKGGEGVGK